MVALVFTTSQHIMAQPANDNPCGAIILATNNVYVTTPNTSTATATPVGQPSCANYQGRDIWYQLTVPASGSVTIQTATQTGITDGGMAIYTATACGNFGTFTELGCGDDQSFFNLMPAITSTCLVPGSTLYIRLWAYGNTQQGTMRIRASAGAAPPAAPANNLPCGATLLNVGATCVNTAGTNVNACRYNITGLAAPCGNMGAAARDVWYRFVAPANGIVNINTTAGTLTDAAMALYSAPSCNGPFALLGCNDDQGPGLMPFLTNVSLTPGQTYYIRIWGYGTASGTFNICLTTPTVPASDCYYTLQLFDTGENGWGASNVTVSINGTPTAYTVIWPNYARTVLIPVNYFDLIEVVYNIAGGPNQGQNQFTITYNGALVHSSASPPAAGMAMQALVECNQPPALQEDCGGAFTICNGGQFANNAGNPGYINDLHAGNAGCLAQGEGQGTWYFFSPQAAGTVGFTVQPATNTDYDFALWGPLTQVSCPPATQPIRCSYALPPHTMGYATGLGQGATDIMEGVPGNGWLSPLTVQAGEIYMLYIDNFNQNTQPFQLSWGLSQANLLDCTVLPVELTLMNATPRASLVDVEWNTATENGSDHFVVEHSTDGETFHAFATVKAAGVSHSSTNYSTVHHDAVAGTNYYRLKMVDEDATFSYSSIVPVVMEQASNSLLPYPNPASSSLRVDLPNGVSGGFAFRISDAAGRIVRTFPGRVGPGIVGMELPLVGIEAGSYLLILDQGPGKPLATGRFIKE